MQPNKRKQPQTTSQTKKSLAKSILWLKVHVEEIVCKLAASKISVKQSTIKLLLGNEIVP